MQVYCNNNKRHWSLFSFVGVVAICTQSEITNVLFVVMNNGTVLQYFCFHQWLKHNLDMMMVQ